MSGKRGSGGENPWVKRPPDDDEDDHAAENPLPPSPWLQEVPPPPSPWAASDDPADDTQGAGGPRAAWGPGTGEATSTGSAGDGPWTDGPGATGLDALWGSTAAPPSLSRAKPEPEKRKRPLLIAIAAGLLVVALIAVALVLLTGGDEAADPAPPGPSPTPSTYSPPANAIPVAFGVSVVPVDGWTVLAKESQGKNLVTYGPKNQARAFFWVRQRQGVSAKEYLLRIVEGETQGETTQLGRERNLPCPKDVLVECAAITYTSTAKGVKVRGYVETYRRRDGVVTALDFRTRIDYAQQAEADAATMKKSVIDSL